MATFMFKGTVTNIKEEKAIREGMCMGLTDADAEVDALRILEEKYPSAKDYEITEMVNWNS